MMPTFIIAGASKSGTTSLCHYLNQHPEIFISQKKEPAYFSDVKTFYKSNIRDYKQYNDIFKNTERYKHRGEASTIYMYDPSSVNYIHRYINDVKLIFILREPIQRAYSNYWQDLKSGRKLPSFSEVIERIDWNNYYDFKQNLFDDKNRGWAYVWASDYILHLSRFLKYFSVQNMLILKTSELSKKNASFFNKIFDFLEVDNTFTPKNLSDKNSATLPKYPFIERLCRTQCNSLPFVKDTFIYKLQLYGKNWIRKKNQINNVYGQIDNRSFSVLYNHFYPYIKSLEDLVPISTQDWIDSSYQIHKNIIHK